MAEQYLKLKDINENNISKRVSLKNRRVLKSKMDPI